MNRQTKKLIAEATEYVKGCVDSGATMHVLNLCEALKEIERSTPAEVGQPALRSSSPEVVTVPAICPDCGFLNVHNCRTDSPFAKRGKVGSKEPQ